MKIRGTIVLAVASAALLMTFVASLCLGRVVIALPQMSRAMFGHDAPGQMTMLVRDMRLPRAIMAIAVGAALAAAGLLMQTVTRNPLATPSVLGITNGAQLGLLIALVCAPDAGEVWPAIASFCGATVCAIVIVLMTLGNTARHDRNYLIVGGNLMGALLGSTSMALLLLSHMNGALSDWTMGELIKVTWPRAAVAGPIMAAGLILAAAIVARVDALQLGREMATSLGVSATGYTLAAMASVVLLAGGAVAIAGPVAYVGLIVPHILSRRHNRDPNTRLLACAMLGGVLTAVADLLSRSIVFPKIVPMGIWTMSLGAIFFVVLSAQNRPAARGAR